MSEFILHHYWPSPFAHKIRLAFGLAEVEWNSVEIPRIPPKPNLMPLTAGYRRTPVLQIGADVFCDTQNIICAIGNEGFKERLFPEGCMNKALVFSSWIDDTVFELAARIVITNSINAAPKEFIQDRGDLYFEKGWSQEKLYQKLPSVILQLDAKLKIIDDILGEGSHIFSSKLSYADISVGYLIWFIRGRWNEGAKILSKYKNLLRVEEEINNLNYKNCKDMRSSEALELANKLTPKSPNGVNSNVYSHLEIGQNVRIKPSGESSDPIVSGDLRYLDSMTIAINHYSVEAGNVAIHFPVSGYEILVNE